MQDNEIFTHLLTLMFQRVDVTKVEGYLLPQLLQSILKKVEKAENDDINVFNKLFITLLDKVNISEQTIEVIRSFLRVLQDRIQHTENNEELKEIFTVIAEKCPEKWVEEILAKRRPNTIVARSPLMPTVGVGTVYYEKHLNGTIGVVIRIPKDRYDSKMLNTVYKDVGYPDLLFGFWIKDKKIVDKKIWATKDRLLRPETKLYRYPFSNVYENGSVCWGINNMVIEHLDELLFVVQSWFSTPNNSHLVHGQRDLKQVFEKLSGRDFDDNDLIPTQHTLADVLGL